MKSPSKLMAAMATTAASWVPACAWAQQQQPAEPRDWYGPRMMDWGPWGFGMIFGPLLMIAGLALAIAVAILLVRWVGGPGYWSPPPHSMPPGRTPLDILKERFARGEINKEEFEERRRVLGD